MYFTSTSQAVHNHSWQSIFVRLQTIYNFVHAYWCFTDISCIENGNWKFVANLNYTTKRGKINLVQQPNA